MRLIILPQAADEFEDAVGHYEDKQAGLGQRFRDEVDRHIRWVVGHAELPRLRPGGYRRVIVDYQLSINIIARSCCLAR